MPQHGNLVWGAAHPVRFGGAGAGCVWKENFSAGNAADTAPAATACSMKLTGCGHRDCSREDMTIHARAGPCRGGRAGWATNLIESGTGFQRKKKAYM